MEPGAPFVAADVGGTWARVALVREARDIGRSVQILHYGKYLCAEHRNLAAILRTFMQTYSVAGTHGCAVACAGFLLGDEVINATLPWKLSISVTREELGLADLALVNDFIAVAHAVEQVDAERVDVQQVDPETTTLLAGTAALGGFAPTLVVGPGTGLGAAVRIPVDGGVFVLGTEAGQAGFAPGTPREREILRVLSDEDPHVPVEAVVSGPGLVNIYRALCVLEQRLPSFAEPSAITEAALAQSDSVAIEALHVFCGAAGSLVGDLILMYGAQGGVYLAGGVLPNLRGFLPASDFVERLRAKGQMRAALEKVPVRLIEHGQLGVIGAAIWYLDRLRAPACIGRRP